MITWSRASFGACAGLLENKSLKSKTNYLPSITYTKEPTSPSLIIMLSLLYSTGYIQSTISRICPSSRFFMKSLSRIARFINSLELKIEIRKLQGADKIQILLLLVISKQRILLTFYFSDWSIFLKTIFISVHDYVRLDRMPGHANEFYTHFSVDPIYSPKGIRLGVRFRNSALYIHPVIFHHFLRLLPWFSAQLGII